MSKKQKPTTIMFYHEHVDIAKIKLKSKFHKLNDFNKLEILELMMKSIREEINNIHPEQE
jgi:hypothetical protein